MHHHLNIVYTNQVENSITYEMIPALQAAFATDGARAEKLESSFMRTRALFLIAHEETHPWATFNEITWMEEWKCDILGLWSLIKALQVKDEVADIVISCVASSLLLHRYHSYLQGRGIINLLIILLAARLCFLRTYIAQGSSSKMKVE